MTEETIWFYFTKILSSDDAKCNKCGEVIKRPKSRPTTQPETLEKLLFLHSNLPLYNFN